MKTLEEINQLKQELGLQIEAAFTAGDREGNPDLDELIQQYTKFMFESILIKQAKGLELNSGEQHLVDRLKK